MPQQVFAEGLKVRECSRCHSRIISTKHSNPYVYRLNAWDVARGLYDKLQDD